ncbi:MAG: hypothetical protein R6V03_03935 [Kiritimatiellia bacterium]
MGVSIHYRGRLDDIALLPSLRDEVGDMANSMGWPSTILNDDWSKSPDATLANGGRVEGHLGLKGIQITPHADSEPLALFFDRQGYLRSPMTMLLILDGTLQRETAWVPMKTQFSGPDTHVWVIGLLKYLKTHYLSNLEVSDESGYWDTGDRRKLAESMALLNGKLQNLWTTISSGRMGDLSGLSADEIASRIERLFRNNRKY